MKRWRLLLDPPAAASRNMAVDEALLQGGMPTLRFYAWSHPSLSVGRFQRFRETALYRKALDLGLAAVRRPTGGKAVLHDLELTYAVILPLSAFPELGGSVASSYRVITQAIAGSLRRLGFPVGWLEPGSPKDSHQGEGGQRSACFAGGFSHELALLGKKVVGSAQTREGGMLLQHGSIVLSLNKRLHSTLFPEAGEAGQLFPQWPGSVLLSDMTAALAQGFEERFRIVLEPGKLTAQEKALAGKLVHEKHENPDWIFSR